MKTYLLIVLLAPAFCFAQDRNNTAPKPAADDCPSWNKKSQGNSKAEYLYFLRTNKAKDQQTAQNSSPISQRTYPSKAIVRYTPEEDPFLIPRKARRAAQPVAAKNAIARPGQTINAVNTTHVTKEEIQHPKPEEEITFAKKEPLVIAPVKKEEEKNIAAEKEATAPGAKDKNKIKKEKKLKKRSNRSAGKKVKSCKPGNANKCPTF